MKLLKVSSLSEKGYSLWPSSVLDTQFFSHPILIVNLTVHFFILPYLFIYLLQHLFFSDRFNCVSVYLSQQGTTSVLVAWEDWRNIFLPQLNAIVMSILWQMVVESFRSLFQFSQAQSRAIGSIVVGGGLLVSSCLANKFARAK